MTFGSSLRLVAEIVQKTGEKPMSDTVQQTVETCDATFEQDVIERSKEVPVVVDFWAPWCQPCRLLTPTLEKLATDFAGRFVLVKANIDQTETVAGLLRIQSIPAVFGFRDGELIDLFVGVRLENQIKLWLQRLVPSEADEAGKIAQIDPQGAERQ